VIERHPILFSTPMIHAILEGRKCQTRRLVKPAPTKNTRILFPEAFDAARWFGWTWSGPNRHDGRRTRQRWKCPYGWRGHRLWVRETFGIVTGNGTRVVYRADGEPPTPTLGTAEKNGVRKMKWTPSIYMRPSQSRIVLAVHAVRAERLHAITETDAVLEGMPRRGARDTFERLWDTINGKRGPWKSNPFVWVVTFQRVG
jgi:hypothetical protein